MRIVEGMKMDTLQEDMIKAIRSHANANYENSGWDYVVECWDDDGMMMRSLRRLMVAILLRLPF